MSACQALKSSHRCKILSSFRAEVKESKKRDILVRTIGTKGSELIVIIKVDPEFLNLKF